MVVSSFFFVYQLKKFSSEQEFYLQFYASHNVQCILISAKREFIFLSFHCILVENEPSVQSVAS